MSALSHRFARGVVLGSAVAIALGCGAPSVAPVASVTMKPAAAASVVGAVHVVAVGDIARAGGGQGLTAALIAAHRPSVLLTLGDTVYQSGSPGEFAEYYAPAYGRFKALTWPIPGNHEYGTPGATGFRAYFAVKGPTWWVRRAGAWTIIGLDSQSPASSAQLAFLRAALAANRGRPTIVEWHRPRVSSGAHGNATDTQPLYRLAAADRDVKILLWGHDHDYQRMALPYGSRVPVTAFVVGTGGAELRPVTRPTPSWSKKVVAGRYGVLDLVLRPHGFSFAFTTTDGVVRDSGRQAW
jgi:hypothetical protein